MARKKITRKKITRPSAADLDKLRARLAKERAKHGKTKGLLKAKTDEVADLQGKCARLAQLVKNEADLDTVLGEGWRPSTSSLVPRDAGQGGRSQLPGSAGSKS